MEDVLLSPLLISRVIIRDFELANHNYKVVLHPDGYVAYVPMWFLYYVTTDAVFSCIEPYYSTH